MDALTMINTTGPATEPIVDPEDLQLRRAILSPEQGFSVYNRLRIDNQERNKKAAAIQRKLNDEQPFNQNVINSAKQSWRRNASTGFMSTMVKRIVPSYKQLIDTSRTLTHSHLPDDTEEANQKSQDFQDETTKFIRKWKGWEPFTNSLCTEDVVFGYTGACWTDEETWMPLFCRQDEALFPDGCPQDPAQVPLWCKLQNFLVHEMVAYLSDPMAAQLAGWNLDNLIESINAAKPENRRSGLTEDARKYQDIYRENSMATSYTEGVKVVETVHLFVQESWGPVSQYIYDRNKGHLLFCHYDRYESMEHCLRLLSVEVGNGKLHGSKGVGRTLYNTAISVEQTRNRIVDSLYLSACLILEETDDAKPQQALTVIHPVAVVGKGYKVSQQEFKVNWQAFQAIDQQMENIAQQQVGAFLPGQSLEGGDGGEKTASEINYIASVEQQLREGTLSRFWSQFLGVPSEMQRRIYSPARIKKAYQLFQQQQSQQVLRVTKQMLAFWQELGMTQNPLLPVQVYDPEDPEDMCVDLILRLLNKGLGPEDIYVLACCPANQVIDDDAQANSQAIQTIVAAYTGNPSIDQKELRKMHISKVLGYAAYERLEIAEEDNTQKQEATRTQLLELQAMFGGDQMPVSPRDPDTIHMDTIMTKAGQILSGGGVPAAAGALGLAQNVLQHFGTHLQQAITKNKGQKDGLEPYIQFMSSAQAALKQATSAQLPPPNATPLGNGAAVLNQPPAPPALPPAPVGPPAHPPDGLPGAPMSGALAPAPSNPPNLPAQGPQRLPAAPLTPNPDGRIPLPLSGGPFKAL